MFLKQPPQAGSKKESVPTDSNVKIPTFTVEMNVYSLVQKQFWSLLRVTGGRVPPEAATELHSHSTSLPFFGLTGFWWTEALPRWQQPDLSFRTALWVMS